MKRVVSGDIVFTQFRENYDKVRVLLGKAYTLRMGKIRAINSSVDVVSENAFDEIIPSPGEAGRGVLPSSPRIVDIIPPGGVSSIFEGSTVPNFGGVWSPTPGSTGEIQFTPIGVPEVFADPRSFGVRIEGSWTPGTTPQQTTIDLVYDLEPVFVEPVARKRHKRESPQPSRSDLINPGDRSLIVPDVLPDDIQGFRPPGSLERDPAEVVFPQIILNLNQHDQYSEGLPFRPRMSVSQPRRVGGWDIYRCRIKIPSLLERIADTGHSPQEVLARLEDFGSVSPYIVYMLGLKGALEQEFVSGRAYLDYQFDFPLGGANSPEVSDLEIKPQYFFYDKEFEAAQRWTRERDVPNFYHMGVRSGDFSVRNIDYKNSEGTNFSSIVVSHSPEELSALNDYYSYRSAVPFGVEINTDVEYSVFSDLLAQNSLLKQFALNLADSGGELSRFVRKADAFIVAGESGVAYSADIFNSYRWLEEMSVQNAHLYWQDQANASIFALLQPSERRGAEQSTVQRVPQAKSIINRLESALRNNSRDLFGCLNNQNSPKERVGAKVVKSRGNTVQNLFFVSGNSPFSRINLFDSQLFYGLPYSYEAHGIYSMFGNEYYYEENSDKPLFDEGKIELFFNIKMRSVTNSVVLPNFPKNLRLFSSLPVEPSVSVEQYRDMRTADSADVLFLLKNSYEKYKGDFVGVLPEDEQVASVVYEAFGPGEVEFRSDDPNVEFQVFRIDHVPETIGDFALGKRTTIRNVLEVGSSIITLESNSFFDSIPLDKDFYYIFRQKDVHGLLSNPSPIYQVRATKIGNRYRVLSRDWSLEELLESRKQKTYPFKRAKRLVCVVPNADKLKSADSFSKKYRLRLVSTKSKKTVVVDFEVKMAENRETY